MALKPAHILAPYPAHNPAHCSQMALNPAHIPPPYPALNPAHCSQRTLNPAHIPAPYPAYIPAHRSQTADEALSQIDIFDKTQRLGLKAFS